MPEVNGGIVKIFQKHGPALASSSDTPGSSREMLRASTENYLLRNWRNIPILMPYAFNFDLSSVPRQFFAELLRASYRAKVHRKLTSTARRIVRAFKLHELTGLDLSSAIALVEDLLEVCMLSEINRPRFEGLRRKALLLPHCSRKHMDSRCRAEFREEISSYVCSHCSDDCLIKIATELAESRGYDVYVVPGSSCIPKIIEKGGYEAVVGVACGMELMLAYRFLGGMPAQGVPLMRNGCSRTVFDMGALERALI